MTVAGRYNYVSHSNGTLCYAFGKCGPRAAQNKSTELCGTQNLTLEQDDIICQSLETNKILYTRGGQTFSLGRAKTER